MAEQIPDGVASSLVNTLPSLGSQEIASIYGVKSEIDWLKRTGEQIKVVLADADRKLQADQLITLLLLILQPIAFRHKVARKIRNIKEQFNDVAATMSKLNLNPRVVEMRHGKSNPRKTSSLVRQEDIVGREGNKNHIIDSLLNHNNNSNQNISMVPSVVGIGGLDKTALAQLAYNDADMESFFDKRMWVCVSQYFNVKVLVIQMLELLLGVKEKDQSLELLQKKLQENLKGKRYLLGLDDVWNQDGEKWLDLKKYLMCGAKGSNILLTSQSQTVANNMGVKTPYCVQGLDRDQSWTYLVEKIGI